MATQRKGLDSRTRDKSGQIHHKRRDTLVGTLRKEYGEHFASGVSDQTTLGELLQKEKASSLTELLKKHKEPKAGYRYLIRLPNVRGATTIIEGTRIGVHDVVGLIVNGSGVDDVVRSFPDLRRAQVYECLAYYEDHRAEIDTLVARQMSTEA
jgi:uncharacterized protein (DUF433 family)